MKSLLALMLFAMVACSASAVAPPVDLDSVVTAPPDLDSPSLQLVVTPTTLVIPEGASMTFDVSLVGDPNGALAVSFTSSDPLALPVSPSSYVFTTANRAAPVHVTVTAPRDPNDVSEVATITIRAADLPELTVMARVNDTTQLCTDGWATPFATTTTFDKLWASCYRLHVDQAGVLTSFGVFATNATGQFRMALYSDLDGIPNMRLSDTAAPKLLVDGINRAAAWPEVTLAVGDAWLCLRVSDPTTVGTSTDQTTPTCHCGHSASPLDSSWDTSCIYMTCTVDAPPNIFITTY